MSAMPTTRPSGSIVRTCRPIALASEILGNSYKLRISMNALRSVDRNGGLDPFILKSKDSLAVAQGAAPEARDCQEGRRQGGLTIR